MGFLFEKLDVYNKSLDFADRILTLTNQFPRGQSVVVDQLKRAALSIPLNIAEGSGRWHRGDKKQFYLISRGSAYECVATSEICKRQKLITSKLHGELKTELDNLCQMLTKLIQAVS